ncbi:hypothetical protein G6F52_012289 [Rhizopus delemar]|nr:hypothetical protein G6F52_012289 [Rhizopus delemar]
MPPGSINQNNTLSISNVLTQEETTELIAQFEQHRKVLKCPHCEKQGLFRRNGHIKAEPLLALFRCTSCGSSYRAITMRSIIPRQYLSLAHAADIMASYLETTFSGDHLKNVQLYEIDTPILPFEIDCPFTRDDINLAIRSLPVKKAPGIDHLRNEMLQPISHLLAPILFHLFHMCWACLITIFRKILERCIQHFPQADGPPLDIAQGGFRESRSALDQVLCLAEISHVLRTHYHVKPVLAFLDIKSAYETVNRSFVWDTLSRYVSSPMLHLLRCLFDDVQIEILLSNTTSRRFHPKTGVLQGSILSPYLYSVFINQLPAQLRPQAITTDI